MTMAFKHGTFVLIVAIFSIAQMVTAGDPNILSDFVVPSNVTQVDANLFTFTGMRVLVRAPIPPAFEVLKASLAEFPGLNGQSVSYAVLLFPSGTLNPPHTHPRSAELLYLLSGSLEVGFVDTEKKLYTQKIESGDMFVFPKGLVHYQYNGDSQNFAFAVSAFGSVSAGTVSLPNTLFTTGIDDTILAKAFKTDDATVEALKAGLRTKA